MPSPGCFGTPSDGQQTTSSCVVKAIFANVQYIQQLQLAGQPREASGGISPSEEAQLIEATDWTAILDNLLRALRTHVRKHKRSLEEQVRMARNAG